MIEMSPRFILGRENVPCVAEVVNKSLKADCTDYTTALSQENIAGQMSLLQGYFNLVTTATEYVKAILSKMDG